LSGSHLLAKLHVALKHLHITTSAAGAAACLQKVCLWCGVLETWSLLSSRRLEKVSRGSRRLSAMNLVSSANKLPFNKIVEHVTTHVDPLRADGKGTGTVKLPVSFYSCIHSTREDVA
jgi:hypothetical protein